MSARERGNALFAAGNYGEAAACYTEGLSSTASADRAVLLSNRAACWIGAGELGAAAADCRAALLLEPCAAKAHYRLARALPREDPAAAVAIACAVALLLPEPPAPELLALYRSIAAASSSAAESLLLPLDVSRVACAVSSPGAAVALSRGATLLVLRPGSYDGLGSSIAAMGVPRYAIVGLGDTTCASRQSHAVFVKDSTTVATYVNVRLAGSGSVAAACVCDGAVLRLIGCRAEDYGDAAVLAAGGTAELTRCTFR